MTNVKYDKFEFENSTTFIFIESESVLAVNINIGDVVME